MGPYGGGHRSAVDSLVLAAAVALTVAGVVVAVAVVRDRVLLAVVVGGGMLVGAAGAVGVAAWFVWRAVDATRAHERDRVMLARAVDLLTRPRDVAGGAIDLTALDVDDDGNTGGGAPLAWPAAGSRRGGGSW